MTDKETWTPVRGWEGLYEVSDQGRVRSLDRVDRNGRPRRGQLLRGRDNGEGYWQVQLSGKGKPVNRRVNRLVALHFVANPRGLPQVGHRNHDRTDNRACNLYWTTGQENTLATWRPDGGRQRKRPTRRIAEVPPQGAPIEHDSVMAAAKAVGGTHSAIYKAAVGGWRSQGRLWRFLD